MTAAPVVGGKSMDDLLDETHSSSDNERSNFDNLLELEDKTVPQPSSSSADGGNPTPLNSSPGFTPWIHDGPYDRMSEQAGTYSSRHLFDNDRLVQTSACQAREQARTARIDAISSRVCSLLEIAAVLVEIVSPPHPPPFRVIGARRTAQIDYWWDPARAREALRYRGRGCRLSL